MAGGAGRLGPTSGDLRRRCPPWPELASGQPHHPLRDAQGRGPQVLAAGYRNGKVEFERDDVYIEHTTPDRNWIFYRRAVGEQNRLFRSPADNPRAGKSVVTKRQCFGSVVDPSGKWIYFNDLPSGPSTLWRIPTDGSPTDQRVVEAIQSRSFAVSKSGIYFVRALSNARWGLYFQPHGENTPTLLTELNRRPIGRITVSPDERELVLPVAVQEGNDILLATLSVP